MADDPLQAALAAGLIHARSEGDPSLYGDMDDLAAYVATTPALAPLRDVLDAARVLLRENHDFRVEGLWELRAAIGHLNAAHTGPVADCEACRG